MPHDHVSAALHLRRRPLDALPGGELERLVADAHAGRLGRVDGGIEERQRAPVGPARLEAELHVGNATGRSNVDQLRELDLERMFGGQRRQGDAAVGREERGPRLLGDLDDGDDDGVLQLVREVQRHVGRVVRGGEGKGIGTGPRQ